MISCALCDNKPCDQILLILKGFGDEFCNKIAQIVDNIVGPYDKRHVLHRNACVDLLATFCPN